VGLILLIVVLILLTSAAAMKAKSHPFHRIGCSRRQFAEAAKRAMIHAYRVDTYKPPC
jgi:hypothetical protein